MNTPLDSTDRDYQLWSLIRQKRDTISKARGKELSQYGISGVQSSILFTILLIEQVGAVATPAEITRWQFREPHTISTLLTRMECEGLVSKVKDLERKNLVRVTVTEKGLRQYELARKRGSIHHLLSVLTTEERQQMSYTLRKIRDNALHDLGESEITWH